MKSIWGSSSHDVYIAGHNDLSGGTMFRFDGSTWRPVPLASAEGGPVQGVIDLSQVIGFTANDVYAAGGVTPAGGAPGTIPSSLVVHFDGTSWSAMQVPPGKMLNGIWGQYRDEMWAAGVSGTLIHYIALTWLPAIFADTVSFSSVSGVSPDDVCALAWRSDTGVHDTTFRYLWHWNGGVWSVADSFAEVAGHPDRFGTRSVWSLLAITYTGGRGMFRQDGSKWDIIVPAQGSGLFNAIYGTVNYSLFVVGDGSGVFHVNQNDWYRYPSFTDPGINYYGVWTDGTEAFVVGNDGRKTYVLHGK
jgi:hypothetical protein